jgi:D-3-phosphoglycerate dehydrogenase / 2-oxoglutarate reductase
MPDSPKNDTPPKVLITEKLSPDGVAMLRTVLDVHERKGLSPDELLQVIPEYDALLVRSETKVTAQLLQVAKNLKVVGRAGVGVDNIGESVSFIQADILP